MQKNSPEQKSNNLWKTQSMQFLEMAFRTDKHEILENPDGYGKSVGKCGDTIEFFLVIHDNRLQSVSFNTIGMHLHKRMCKRSGAAI